MRSKQLGANKLRLAHHACATLMSLDLKASHYAFFFPFLWGGEGGGGVWNVAEMNLLG